MAAWIILGCVFAGTMIAIVCKRHRKALLTAILRALNERGALGVVLIIRAMREKEICPQYAPEFLVNMACRVGIKKGLITRRGHVIIPRFAISQKGKDLLDQL